MIVDQHGRPFDFSVVNAEPQTAKLRSLHLERSEHTNGLTPVRLAALFRAAEEGDLCAQSDLFDDMEERDAHLASELAKRRRAVSRLDWQLVAPKNATHTEQAATEQLTEIITGLDGMRDLLFDLTDAIGKSFAAVEQEWRRTDNVWQPCAFDYRPQRWFQIEPGYREALHLRDHTPTGQPLQPLGWIVHYSRAKSGALARAPLMRACAWPYLFRSFSLGDWAEFLEVYGYPVRLGKYGPVASKDDKDTLLRAVIDIGRRAGGIIPEGMGIELLKAVEGDPQAFGELIAWADRSQSKLVLGGTLTSQADGNSSTNALGKVHDEVRQELRDDDAARLADTLTRDLVYPIAVLNGLVTSLRRCPRFEFDVGQADDLAKYADALPKLVGAGMPVSIGFVQDRLRIPAPKEGEATLTRTAAQGDFGGVGATPVAAKGRTALLNALATALNAYEGTGQSDETVDALADQLTEATNPVLEQWIEQLRSMVDKAADLQQLRQMLLDGFGGLPTGDLVKIMEAGFALAALTGAAEVANGR